MAVGYSPALPLRPDSVDGFYKLTKTLGEVTQQNLKMLILTTPGERIMHPEFGVGARNYLFDQTANTYQELNVEIVSQVRKYIPYIEIVDVVLYDVNLDETQVHNYRENQYMGLQIVYTIPNLALNDTLKIVISNQI
jgi:phage baseplate assembly protein W